jgi:hypothetical protein
MNYVIRSFAVGKFALRNFVIRNFVIRNFVAVPRRLNTGKCNEVYL